MGVLQPRVEAPRLALAQKEQRLESRGSRKIFREAKGLFHIDRLASPAAHENSGWGDVHKRLKHRHDTGTLGTGIVQPLPESPAYASEGERLTRRQMRRASIDPDSLRGSNMTPPPWLTGVMASSGLVHEKDERRRVERYEKTLERKTRAFAEAQVRARAEEDVAAVTSAARARAFARQRLWAAERQVL